MLQQRVTQQQITNTARGRGQEGLGFPVGLNCLQAGRFSLCRLWSVRQQVVKAEATGQHSSRQGPRARGWVAWGHSRFRDSDVVGRALETQAAEAALEVVAGLGLGAVVGAQGTLVQVCGGWEGRMGGGGIPHGWGGPQTTLPGLRGHSSPFHPVPFLPLPASPPCCSLLLKSPVCSQPAPPKAPACLFCFPTPPRQGGAQGRRSGLFSSLVGATPTNVPRVTSLSGTDLGFMPRPAYSQLSCSPVSFSAKGSRPGFPGGTGRP